jgi:hypothetical protein
VLRLRKLRGVPPITQSAISGRRIQRGGDDSAPLFGLPRHESLSGCNATRAQNRGAALPNVAGTILINPIGGDITETIANIFNAGEAPCRKFVDSHFAVLSDVRSLAGAGDSAGPSLFIAPLTDKQGKVLWGYSNWCDLLKFAQ